MGLIEIFPVFLLYLWYKMVYENTDNYSSNIIKSKRKWEGKSDYFLQEV